MKTTKKNALVIAITFIWTLVTLVGISWVNRNVENFSGVLRIIILILPWWPMLLATAFFMKRDGEGLKSLGFSKEKLGLQVILGVFVAAITLTIFIILPELIFGVRMGYARDITFVGVVAQFIYQLLAVALVEEIIFRGHIYKKLLDIKDNKWFAILISSALFGFFHILNFNPFQIVITAIIGIVWCLFREKIKHCTLLSLIIAHALHNALIHVVVGVFFGA